MMSIYERNLEEQREIDQKLMKNHEFGNLSNKEKKSITISLISQVSTTLLILGDMYLIE